MDSGLLSGIEAASWICLFCFVLVTRLIATRVYDVLFSPLSAVPGPWYSAISDIWLFWHAARFRQCEALHRMFEQYGPIVRVGPRKVVFCDWDTTKSVYCVHKLPKSAFYKALVTDGHGHSLITGVEHALRRRTFAAHYAFSHVILFYPEISDCVIRLVEALEDAPRESVDCIHVLRHLLADIIRITVFALPPLAVDNWTIKGEDPICSALRAFPMRSILRSVTPDIIWRALAYFPNSRWLEMYRSDHTLATFVRDRLYELQRDMQAYQGEKDPDWPMALLPQMLAQRSAGSTAALTDQDIVSECMAHLIAGVDTSSSTFGFMLWELSRRPDVVAKLRNELDDVVSGRRTLPEYALLAKQPYLSAFLNEGFRMYGAVSSLLERVVTEGERGGEGTCGLDLLGFEIPPGTIVGTQAWSLHRDPALFPHPDVFDPERWLPCAHDDNDARRARMAQGLMAFGAGTRACPGRHQAQIVFRVVLAALVVNFDLSADPCETDAESMAPRDAFAIRPAARECRLTFTPRPG